MKNIKKMFMALLLVCAVIIPTNTVFALRTSCSVELTGAYYNMTNGLVNKSYPELKLKAEGDSLNDMAFHLVLEGAEWDLNKMSRFDSNIKVTSTSSTDIQLKIKREFFKSLEGGGNSEFSIPLYAKNFSDGLIYLKLTDTPNYMNDAKFLFGCNVAGNFSAKYDEKADIYKTGVSVFSDITITDSSYFSATPDNTVFKITVGENTFKLVGVPEIVGTGKYEGVVYGELEGGSTLSIKVNKATPAETGTIIVKGLSVNRTAAKITDAPKLNVYAERVVSFETNEGKTQTRKVQNTLRFTSGTFINRSSTSVGFAAEPTTAVTETPVVSEEITEIVTETADEAESVTGEAAEAPETVETVEEATEAAEAAEEYEAVGGSVSFTAGAGAYENDKNGAALISENGRMLLPLRALATGLGVADDEIAYDAETKTVAITRGSKLIVIEQNGDYMYINNVRKEVTTPAINYEGSMYLPLRDVCEAFGIPDENISFNAETKTVTIEF